MIWEEGENIFFQKLQKPVSLTDILQKPKLQKRLDRLKNTAGAVIIIAKRLMTLVVIEEVIIRNFWRVTSLNNRSILAKAFRGELAPLTHNSFTDYLVSHIWKVTDLIQFVRLRWCMWNK